MTQQNTMVLRVFNDIVEATIARDKLTANGIASFVEDENPIGLNPLGGIELKIFEKDRAIAEEIIGQP